MCTTRPLRVCQTHRHEIVQGASEHCRRISYNLMLLCISQAGCEVYCTASTPEKRSWDA